MARRFRVDVKEQILRYPLQVMAWILDKPKSEIVSEALTIYLEQFFDELKPSNPSNWMDRQTIEEWRKKLKAMLPVFVRVEE